MLRFRIRGGLGDRAGRRVGEPVVDEVENHPGAGLRPIADRDRGLRADLTGIRLPLTEVAHVGHRGACRDDRVGRTDLRTLGLRQRAAGWQQRQHNHDPKRHAHQKKHDAVPYPVVVGGVGSPHVTR